VQLVLTQTHFTDVNNIQTPITNLQWKSKHSIALMGAKKYSQSNKCKRSTKCHKNNDKKLSYRSGNARRSISVDILSTAAQTLRLCTLSDSFGNI